MEVPDKSDISIATANVSGAIFNNPTRQQQIEIGTVMMNLLKFLVASMKEIRS